MFSKKFNMPTNMAKVVGMDHLVLPGLAKRPPPNT